MIGGIEETSASFEARSAPRSYPTPINGLVAAHLTRRRPFLNLAQDEGNLRLGNFDLCMRPNRTSCLN